MNNKGFLRILEAVIAIIIIFMFTYYIMPKNAEKNDVEGDKIRLLQKTILDEISHNEGFRDCILDKDKDLRVWEDCKVDIITYAGGLDKRYQSKIDIVKCNINNINDVNCKPCEVGGVNVYVSEIFVSGSSSKQRVTVCIGK